MRGMKTARALGEIDEEFIAEASPEKIITIKVFPWKYVAIASSLILVACIGLMAVLFGNKLEHDYAGTDSDSSQTDSQWEIKEVEVSLDDSSTTIGQLKSWKDMTLTERYPDFGGDRPYQATGAKIDESMIEGKYTDYRSWLNEEDSTVHIMPANNFGYDWIAIDPFEHNDPRGVVATVYTIKNIDSSYALAVKFPEIESSIDKKEFDDYYVYICTNVPEYHFFDTNNHLGLQNILSFGSAYYYTDDGKTIEFEQIDSQKIINIILENTPDYAKVESAEKILLMDDYKRRLDISANIDLLGIKNKSFTISDNGYLITNLFSSAWIYNIGTQASNQIIDYIRSNYKGYEIVYKQPDVASNQQLYVVDKWSTARCKISKDKLDGAIVQGAQTQIIGDNNKPISVKYSTYAIKGIDKDYACAIKFDRADDYLVYFSSRQDPKTLDELAQAVDLKNNLSVDSIYYITDDSKTFVYKDLDKDKILEILLKDSKNDKVLKDHSSSVRLSIHVGHDLLGDNEHYITVDDDGILWTDITVYPLTFDIGTEKVKLLKEYVTSSGKGYEMKENE